MRTSWLLVLIILKKVTTQSISNNTKCDLSRQFDCGTECIPKPWKCDNIKDCENGADEIDCDPNECNVGELLCKSGRCEPDGLKCDGHGDCDDRSDEEFCGHISYRFSANSSFNFEDTNHYKFDGGYDKNGCLPGFGLCAVQKLCIPNRLFCDGIKHCVDDADEENCTPWTSTEDALDLTHLRINCKNKFVCKERIWCENRVCINEEELCNGKKECPLGDDESEKCSECSEKHCEHQCKNTPTGAKCECNKGYRLDSDGFSCVDLDECTLPERACHHFCENQIGSFRCSCAKGYHLKADGKNCDLTNTSEGFLLIEYNEEIRRKPLEDFTESNFTSIYKLQGKGPIRSFDYFRRDDKLFISIYEKQFGKDKLVVVRNGTSIVLRENVLVKKHDYLTVDWIGNNLFFQEEEVDVVEGKNVSRNFIAVCTIDGRFYRRLIEIEDGHDVKSFVIHPMRGLLFWHDWPHNRTTSDPNKLLPYRIMMANMDGSQIQALVIHPYRLSKSFAIDHVNHDIYYEQQDDTRIRRVNIDTRKTEMIPSDMYFSSVSMAYHNGFLYLTNRYGNLRVQEVTRKNARVHRVLKCDYHGIPPRMVVNDSLHQLEPSNPCADLDCPWICVIVPDFTAKCLCPDGYTPSGITCIPPSTEIKEQGSLIGLELMSEYCETGMGCLNGGSCREVSNKTRIVCDCLEPFDGLYCERRKPDVVISTTGTTVNPTNAVTTIVVFLVLIAISFGVYYCFFRHRRNKKNTVTDMLPLVVKSSDDPVENDDSFL